MTIFNSAMWKMNEPQAELISGIHERFALNWPRDSMIMAWCDNFSECWFFSFLAMTTVRRHLEKKLHLERLNQSSKSSIRSNLLQKLSRDQAQNSQLGYLQQNLIVLFSDLLNLHKQRLNYWGKLKWMKTVRGMHSWYQFGMLWFDVVWRYIIRQVIHLQEYSSSE